MSAVRSPRGARALPERFRWPLAPAEAEQRLRAAAAARGTSLWHLAWARLARDRAARICALFLTCVAGLSALAPLWPLPSPVAIELVGEPRAPELPWRDFGRDGFEAPRGLALAAPDRALLALRARVFGDWQIGHWLGTDAKGRDLFARLVWGSRTSLLAAAAAALASLCLGVGVGALAGYAGGRTDAWLMRLVDVLYSLPLVFLVIFLITLLSAWRDALERVGLSREGIFYLVIGAVSWLSMARVVRGSVRALATAAHVEAARALGARPLRVLLAHVLPNALGTIAVYLTLTVPSVMLFEAFLSFLGLGVEPPKVSWGTLAAEGAEALSPLLPCWWLVLFPALAMGSVLLALNVLGDALRDALDTRAADAPGLRAGGQR